MKVVEFINEINRLSIVEKNGLCCVHWNASNVVRFGNFELKNGLETLKRQRYRGKDWKKLEKNSL